MGCMVTTEETMDQQNQQDGDPFTEYIYAQIRWKGRKSGLSVVSTTERTLKTAEKKWLRW